MLHKDSIITPKYGLIMKLTGYTDVTEEPGNKPNTTDPKAMKFIREIYRL